LTCHTAAGGVILGFNTAQLNRDYGYSSGAANQLAALSSAGFFDNPPAHPQVLRTLAPLDDETVSRAYRVRSYLFANCGQCHQPAGNVYSAWDSRITTPITKAQIIWGQLLNSSGPDDKVVTPGNTNTSAIIQRMMAFGTQRMPPLATSILDTKAIQLISDWITQDLPTFQSYQDWAATYFGQNVPPGDQDSDGDGVSNYAEYLMGTNPLHPDPGAAPLATIENGQVKLTFQHPANRGLFFESTDNFISGNWTPVNDPQNKLLFPAETTTRSIFDALSGQQKFYRMRVIEP
jgi:mono/diheme cytochrome c family protein